MREAAFVKQNTDKWSQYETWVKSADELNIDELTHAYNDLTADLAYAQTHYPASSITDYLNVLTLQLHHALYRKPVRTPGRLWRFYSLEVPLAVYDARRAMLVSLVLFLVSMAIGVVSTLGDFDFAQQILGSDYVWMTIRNIHNGDPVAVYQTGTGTESFLMIAWNNIRVSFITFAMGIFTCLGSGYVIFTNGVMCGTFISFFHHFGVLSEAALGIMQHGTLELSTIVINGCAGIVMGNGWLFPGTYNRLQSFQRSARRGLTILLGNLPFIIAAAVIEGYFTRYSHAPTALRVAVIVLSLTAIVYYFVLLPIRRHRQCLTHQPAATS